MSEQGAYKLDQAKREVIEAITEALQKSTHFQQLEIFPPHVLTGGILSWLLSTNSEKTVFISSTFDDTKHEQDELLKKVFPFIVEQAKRLGMQFNVVTMRFEVTFFYL